MTNFVPPSHDGLDDKINEKLYIAERLAKDAARHGACPAAYNNLCRVMELYAEAKVLMEQQPKRFTKINL